MAGEDFLFERPMDAVTLAVILGLLIVLITGAFIVVGAEGRPAPPPPPGHVCTTTFRSPEWQAAKTGSMGLPDPVDSVWGITCVS